MTVPLSDAVAQPVKESETVAVPLSDADAHADDVTVALEEAVEPADALPVAQPVGDAVDDAVPVLDADQQPVTVGARCVHVTDAVPDTDPESARTDAVLETLTDGVGVVLADAQMVPLPESDPVPERADVGDDVAERDADAVDVGEGDTLDERDAIDALPVDERDTETVDEPEFDGVGLCDELSEPDGLAEFESVLDAHTLADGEVVETPEPLGAPTDAEGVVLELIVAEFDGDAHSEPVTEDDGEPLEDTVAVTDADDE